MMAIDGVRKDSGTMGNVPASQDSDGWLEREDGHATTMAVSRLGRSNDDGSGKKTIHRNGSMDRATIDRML